MNNARASSLLLQKLQLATSTVQDTEVKGVQPATQVLKDPIPPVNGGEYSFTHIVNVVCRYYDISRMDIFSTRRPAYIAFPRQVICYLAVHYTVFSQSAIGNFLKRDHTVVGYAVKKIKQMCKDTPGVETQIKEIVKLLGTSATHAVCPTCGVDLKKCP